MDISQLMNKIDYQFKDIEWLHRALIHRSYSSGTNNERLEFLGDSVLNLVVANYLFTKYPDEAEGFLTRMRTKLVNGKTLAKFAVSLKLNKFISLTYKLYV